MINNNTPGNGHDILEQLRQSRQAWYSVGLFAVIIKMVEVVLRMPGIKKNNFSARNS